MHEWKWEKKNLLYDLEMSSRVKKREEMGRRSPVWDLRKTATTYPTKCFDDAMSLAAPTNFYVMAQQRDPSLPKCCYCNLVLVALSGQRHKAPQRLKRRKGMAAGAR